MRQDAELFRNKMAKRQSVAKSRRDDGTIVNSGTSPRRWTSVQQDAGMKRISRHSAGIGTVMRGAGRLREKCGEQLSERDSGNVDRRGAGTVGWLRQVTVAEIVNVPLDAKILQNSGEVPGAGWDQSEDPCARRAIIRNRSVIGIQVACRKVCERRVGSINKRKSPVCLQTRKN